MAKITMEEAEEILTFPKDTILELKIAESNIIDVPGRNGRDSWQKVELKFKILGIQALGDGGNPDDYDNWITRDIYGSVSARFNNNPENKLRQWAEAIFRQELGVGFELDTDLFVGRSVRGITDQYDAKATDSQGNAFKRHRVEHLLPFGETRTQTPAPATSAPAATTPDPWATQPPAPAANDPWAAGGRGWDDEPPF